MGRRAQRPAAPARAHAGGLHPVAARVQPRVRRHDASGWSARRKDLLILHPGPMNRGVEIDSDVADGPHSVILAQVTNGVAVRMAVLYLLAGGTPELGARGGGGD